MRPYQNYTDEELQAEIDEYRAARKAGIKGGGFEEVAGEGRKIKYFGTDLSAIDRELRELYLEAQERGWDLGGWPGGAIGVEIG
jgi:hypothetical protein